MMGKAHSPNLLPHERTGLWSTAMPSCFLKTFRWALGIKTRSVEVHTGFRERHSFLKELLKKAPPDAVLHHLLQLKITTLTHYHPPPKSMYYPKLCQKTAQVVNVGSVGRESKQAM